MFFGYEFSKDGLRADPRKLEAIKNLPVPTSVSEVRSFLGTVAYCGRFLPNLSDLSAPLRRLTKKSARWQWGSEEQMAFDLLKKQLNRNLTNSYFDPNLRCELVVDAGPEGLDAILSQPRGSSPGVIAYASRSLTDTEKGWSQIERELLAVCWGIDHFKLYLFGSRFQAVTDHKPLIGVLNGTKQTTPRLERLRLHLQGYDFVLEYRPGSSNPSDYLSRHPLLS